MPKGIRKHLNRRDPKVVELNPANSNSIGYFKLSHFEPKTISFLSFSSLLLAISKFFFFFSFPLRVQNKSNYRATIKPGWKKVLMVITFNC